MKQGTSAPRKEWRIKKVLRLTAYCIAVTGIAGGLALRSAYGNMMESALEIGSELGQMGETGDKRPVRLNGEPIFVSSTVQPVDLEELLDRVVERCRDNPTELIEALPGMSQEGQEKLGPRLRSLEAAGVVRYVNEDRGVVVCFTRPEGSVGGINERLERVTGFLDSGDLSKFGNVRYVFAERTPAGLTHVVTAWTEGSFNLYNLFPGKGDAPGSDLPDVPRPARSVRLLTAGADGVPYSVHIYDSPEGPEAILADYDREMEQRGWEATLTDVPHNRRVYGRDDVHVYVLPRQSEGRTLVTLVQMRGKQR